MKVYNKEINEELVLKKINRPVKYSFVKKAVEKYLKNNPKQLNLVSKGKISHKFIKDIRKILHDVTGAYKIKKPNKRYKLLKKGLYSKILNTSISTKERNYGLLYEEIFHITGKPKTILDLGAGINPVSLYNYKDIEITALEINKNDVDFVNEYFKKFKGKSLLFDVNKTEKLKNFKSDVAFLFKLVDVLDLSKGHKNAEAVIDSIKCKWLVVSFATKTLSGKDMNFPYRGWFERLLERKKWKYIKLIKPNEIFYVVEKK